MISYKGKNMPAIPL